MAGKSAFCALRRVSYCLARNMHKDEIFVTAVAQSERFT
jgi:hypothetical protein